MIGVAAELQRSGEGFELATRTEAGRTSPNIGLIVQAFQNFYEPLYARADLEGAVIAVRKRGKGAQRPTSSSEQASRSRSKPTSTSILAQWYRDVLVEEEEEPAEVHRKLGETVT